MELGPFGTRFQQNVYFPSGAAGAGSVYLVNIVVWPQIEPFHRDIKIDDIGDLLRLCNFYNKFATLSILQLASLLRRSILLNK